MAYLGKTFKFERQEKFDEFLASLGLPKEKVDAIAAKTPSQSLVKSGDSYTLSIGDINVNFKSGAEFDETLDGKQVKTTFVVDGNTVTQTQKFPDGHVATFKRVFSDNKLAMSATNDAWNDTAYRFYSA